jgi:hypothetical protein
MPITSTVFHDREGSMLDWTLLISVQVFVVAELCPLRTSACRSPEPGSLCRFGWYMLMLPVYQSSSLECPLSIQTERERDKYDHIFDCLSVLCRALLPTQKDCPFSRLEGEAASLRHCHTVSAAAVWAVRCGSKVCLQNRVNPEHEDQSLQRRQLKRLLIIAFRARRCVRACGCHAGSHLCTERG